MHGVYGMDLHMVSFDLCGLVRFGGRVQRRRCRFLVGRDGDDACSGRIGVFFFLCVPLNGLCQFLPGFPINWQLSPS